MESTQINLEELKPFRSKLYLLSDGDQAWIEHGIGYPIIVEDVLIT